MPLFPRPPGPGTNNADVRASLVYATWMSPYAVHCMAPQVGTALANAVSTVEVSINGQDFTQGTSGFFLHYEPERIASIYPHQGPPRGGTLVNITLQNAGSLGYATSTPYCLFGNESAVEATTVAPGVLKCLAPPSRNGLAPLEVSGNLIDYTSDGHLFEFVGSFMRVTVSPDHGPTRGSTLVTFTGDRIGQTADRLQAIFGDIAVSASARSRDSVVCRTPNVTKAGQLSTILRSHSADLEVDRPIFYYYDPAEVHRILPNNGPVAGSTRVLVEGSGFGQFSAWYCSFGPQLTPARTISTTMLECETPRQDRRTPYDPLVVSFGLGTGAPDNQPLQSGLYFTYTPVPFVQAIMPTRGPAAGGTRILVRLVSTGCMNCSLADMSLTTGPRGLLYECAFGTSTRVAASFIDAEATTVACVTPSNPSPGHVTVSVAQAYSDVLESPTSWTFEYITMRVTSVLPVSGPTRGGTRITFLGANLGLL